MKIDQQKALEKLRQMLKEERRRRQAYKAIWQKIEEISHRIEKLCP